LNWVVSIGIGLVLAGFVRMNVLASYQATTDAVSPEIPHGSYVMVFKLARAYSPGDIIVYRAGNKAILGRVAQTGPVDGTLQVERRNKPPQPIPISSVAGKVIFNTRPRVKPPEEK